MEEGSGKEDTEEKDEEQCPWPDLLECNRVDDW